MKNWNRKEHYQFFRSLDMPHVSFTANIDITHFNQFVKEKKIPFFKSFLYAIARTANEIKEFRYRIREDGVVEHEIIHPSYTMMTSKGVFRFISVDYYSNLDLFIKKTIEKENKMKDVVELKDRTTDDDVIFTTCIPWVSFTHMMHPIHLSPADSIPRFGWGKYFEENSRLKIPLNVQGHHALLDGAHIGEFYIRIQELLDHFEEKVYGLEGQAE
jgi:chloramphenicol O-acetyltransferase type A